MEWTDVMKAIYRQRELDTIGRRRSCLFLTVTLGIIVFLVNPAHTPLSMFWGMLVGFFVFGRTLVNTNNESKNSLVLVDKKRDEILSFLNQHYKNMTAREWTELEDKMIVEAVERIVECKIVDVITSTA